MASRDYKDKGGPARGGRGAERKRGSPMAIGIVIGVLLGLAAALGVALYIKGPGPFSERKQVSATPASEPATNALPKATSADPLAPADNSSPKPGAKLSVAKPGDAPAAKSLSNDLTFYGILEGKEKVVVDPPPPVAPGTERNLYLQVGAFRSAAEADDLKAQLALAGIEARIQPVRLPPGDKLVHRVRLGPFNAEEAVLARNRLRQNQIDAIFVQEKQRAP